MATEVRHKTKYGKFKIWKVPLLFENVVTTQWICCLKTALQGSAEFIELRPLLEKFADPCPNCKPEKHAQKKDRDAAASVLLFGV